MKAGFRAVFVLELFLAGVLLACITQVLMY
jgi:hypothetical protein